jgi:plasmid stability protein
MVKKKRLLININEDQHKKLKIYAATKSKTMKDVIIGWLEDAVRKQENQETDGLSA